MTKTLSICVVLMLAGCAPPTPDRKMQQQLFFECLQKAPAGPVATKYNDWSEVIDSCQSAAYYMAMPQQ